MPKIIFILGTVAVATNILIIWYAKRRGRNKNADISSTRKEDSDAVSLGFLNSEEKAILKQSAAAELGISVEELDQMTVDEITELAKTNELIN